jgi:hypothetical protein
MKTVEEAGEKRKGKRTTQDRLPNYIEVTKDGLSFIKLVCIHSSKTKHYKR